MEQIIEVIKADPINAFGIFIVLMAGISVSSNVAGLVKSMFNYNSKYDSEWTKQNDKWGDE